MAAYFAVNPLAPATGPIAGQVTPQQVIDGVAAGRVESRSIGLMNVHQRVKLLYGDGLHLKRLEPGTEVCFYLPDPEVMPC